MAKTITIKLTHAEAKLVFGNVDGWLDAGACEGGLEDDEKAALWKLNDQIREQVFEKKPAKEATP